MPHGKRMTILLTRFLKVIGVFKYFELLKSRSFNEASFDAIQIELVIKIYVNFTVN